MIWLTKSARVPNKPLLLFFDTSEPFLRFLLERCSSEPIMQHLEGSMKDSRESKLIWEITN